MGYPLDGDGPAERGAKRVESRAHLVSQLRAPDGPLQLVAQTEYLVGRNAAGAEDQRSVLVREGAHEDLGRVEGVPRIEVPLDVDDGAWTWHDDPVEQAQVRPALDPALDPVKVADHLRRLVGRVSQQRLAELPTVARGVAVLVAAALAGAAV